MLDKQVTITTGTLLTLIRRCAGEPHTVLASTPTWYSDTVRREQDQRADAELARQGLAGGNGLDRGLLATVETIARPVQEYYAWVAGGHDGQSLNYTLLAGSAGGEAFVLLRNTDRATVVLATLRPDQLLDGFLTQIPNLAPGKGQQMSVPKSQVTGDGDSGDEDGTVLRSHRPSAGAMAAEELKRVLALPRLGGGSLYAATRNRVGTRQRVERPVNYIDTKEGRWLTEEAPGAGESVITFTPATPQLLGDRLRRAKSMLGG